jgi:MFS family permease
VFVIRDRPTERDGLYYLTADDRGGGRKPHGHGGAANASHLSWREVARRKNFWLLVAIYLPMLGLYGGCSQNLAPYATSHGWSQQSAGVLISVLSLSHVVSTLVLGLLSDRFGNRLPFAGLAAVMAIGGVLFAFGSGLPVITVACVLVGLGGGEFTLLAAAIAVEFGPEGMGRAFGLCMLFIPLTALSPFAVAKTQEATGSYAPALIVLTVLVIIAGGLSLLLRERRAGEIQSYG